MTLIEQIQAFLQPLSSEAAPPVLPDFIQQLGCYDLMLLAIEDCQSFVKLDALYPEYLPSKVESFEALSLFCLVLEAKWSRLLKAPQVKPYLTSGGMVMSLLNQITMFGYQRLDYAEKFIKTLDELVLLCRANPFYLSLVAQRDRFRSGRFEDRLGPLAGLVQNQADLARLSYGSSSFIDCVKNIPKLKRLITDPLSWVYQVMQYCHPLVQKKDAAKPGRLMLEARSLAFGLFSEHLHPPIHKRPNFFDSSWIMTMGEYMEFTQYDRVCGYYSAGSIKFTNAEQRGHYRTEASSHKTLAVSIAARAFQMWWSMPDLPDFHLLEIGAGDGDLCDQVWKFVDAKMAIDYRWEHFSQCLKYSIIEKAPALVERQKTLLAKRIADGQVSIFTGDALGELPAGLQRPIDLHVSNELVDMFPSEEIYMDTAGELYVCIALPSLTPSGLAWLESSHPGLAENIKLVQASWRARLDDHLIAIPAQQTVLPLPANLVRADTCNAILRLMHEKDYQGPATPLLFQKRGIPLACRPEIEAAFHQQASLIRFMHPDTSQIFCPQIMQYARIIAQSKVSFVVDYGNPGDKILNDSYRSFGDFTCYREYPFANPCKSDVTYDINFTALAEAVKQAMPGASFYFGRMGALYPCELVLPNDYLHELDAKELQRFATEEYSLLVCYRPDSKYYSKLRPSEGRAVSEYQFFRRQIQFARQVLTKPFEVASPTHPAPPGVP